MLDHALAFWRDLPQPWLTAIALAAAFAFILHVIGRLVNARRRRATAGRRAVDRDEVREFQKTIARLESENAALSTFFRQLPDFTKGINARLDRRAIPPLLLEIVDALLSPTQILIFQADDHSDLLTLVQQKGAGADARGGMQVSFGEGRIGWVAENRIAMGVDDFIREMRLTGNTLDATNQYGCNVELCAPMVHEGATIGVISVGGIARHNKYEKSMLTLIADLGSIALHNNTLFSRTQVMANCDGLTSLYNKRFFMDRLSEEIRKAEQAHHPVSLFIFDLDNFKHYNDTQGHQAGDEVLKTTGQILRETVRPEDIPARYGGEEFIVIWARTSKDDAMTAAERVRRRVAEHPYPNRETQPLKVVSLSGGVATFPDDGRTGADLIKAADAALYEAKRAGRNRICRSRPRYFSDEADGGLAGVEHGSGG